MEDPVIITRQAISADAQYADEIVKEMKRSAIERGCGISERKIEYIVQKINEGKAIIAITTKGEWAGFSYYEVWSNGEFISNSGMIVSPAYRKHGVAHEIKEQLFALCRQRYPKAKIFSITSGLSIMKMNTALGFHPVTYNEICQEEVFWKGCASCVNYDVLCSKQHKNCLCTAMLFEPGEVNCEW
jgi:GNAT superfamily N-acetyltransferase